MTTFRDLHLHADVERAILSIGFEKPTPVQQQAIPLVMGGSDLVVSAHTGTGKTAAFLLPLLHSLVSRPVNSWSGPRAIILVPTRELAIQISKEATRYARGLRKVKTVAIYGGVPYHAQLRDLSRPYEILVATPGRLTDLMGGGRIDTSSVEMFVLDEADRMLDMGFIDAVEGIAAALPESRQTLLFSATLDRKVMGLSGRLQKNPQEIRVEADLASMGQIEQKLYYVDGIDHKRRILARLLSEESVGQAIIFTATKRSAEELAGQLEVDGHESAALHGDMHQSKRTRTITNFRKGRVRFLVATDVAARGIDVADLSHVINFDLPMQPEDFIHRVGRTGRAGASGTAITMATYREERALTAIGKLLGKPVPICTLSGLEPKRKASTPFSKPPRGKGKFPPRNRSYRR